MASAEHLPLFFAVQVVSFNDDEKSILPEAKKGIIRGFAPYKKRVHENLRSASFRDIMKLTKKKFLLEQEFG